MAGWSSGGYTWRGIVLLSVGTKVMARIVATRLARWADPWLDEALQVSCRVAEEVNRVSSDEVVLRFFDI